MSDYENCPYCNTILNEELRARYSNNDKVWECPKCKANVTKQHKEEAPSGYAASTEIRRKRQYIYTCCFEQADIKSLLLKEYLIQTYGTTKITALDDEQINDCATAFDYLNTQYQQFMQDEIEQLRLQGLSIAAKRMQIENLRAKNLFGCLPEEVKAALLRNNRTKGKITNLLNADSAP